MKLAYEVSYIQNVIIQIMKSYKIIFMVRFIIRK